MQTFAICLCLISVTAAADEPAALRFVKAWGQEGVADGEFEFPIGIAIHEQTIFVTDHYNNRVQTLDFDGKHLASLEVLPNPGGITADRDGTLFISHFPVSRLSKAKHPDRISVYTPTGKLLREWGQTGIIVDPHDHVWVASINGRIQQFDTNGTLLGGLQSSQGSKPDKFFAPHTLAFNNRGEFFVVDSFNHRIQKFATGR